MVCLSAVQGVACAGVRLNRDRAFSHHAHDSVPKNAEPLPWIQIQDGRLQCLARDEIFFLSLEKFVVKPLLKQRRTDDATKNATQIVVRVSGDELEIAPVGQREPVGAGADDE